MKKLIIAFIFTVIISPVFISPVFAQSNGENMYYQNITIEKIYLSEQGYVVQYRKGINGLGTIGVPYEWFTAAGGKAEILHLPPGTDWPSMSIFYKDGKFDYIRLYVHKSKAHWTWAVVPLGSNVTAHFKDPEDIRIEY